MRFSKHICRYVFCIQKCAPLKIAGGRGAVNSGRFLTTKQIKAYILVHTLSVSYIVGRSLIIDRMIASASCNSKEAFLIWGFNLDPRCPSIGLVRTDTFQSLITVDHENLKLLQPKTKNEQFGPIVLGAPDGSLRPKILRK